MEQYDRETVKHLLIGAFEAGWLAREGTKVQVKNYLGTDAGALLDEAMQEGWQAPTSRTRCE